MSPNDAAICRHIVQRHARTFSVASRFLPPEKRRAAFALYAFCRLADDIVDVRGHEADSSEVVALLSDYRRQLELALDGRASGPVLSEVLWAARRFQVPSDLLVELVEGVARDCAPVRYVTWRELSAYCEGVASSVGEMCTYVFGVVGDQEACRHARRRARTLGIAMQLTNILRDVGEDARIGRCYLPDEDLAQFGLTRDRVLAGHLRGDARWRALMIFEVARARALYADAMPGISLLSPDSRRCAAACAMGYAGILGAIEALDYDTFSSRARLGAVARAGVLWTAWRTPLGTTPSSEPPRTPTRGELVAWS